MKLFKNYKKLYNEQMKNNKVMNDRNIDLGKRYVEYQENALAKEKAYREKIAELKIELEDAFGFLAQEKEANQALRKERKNLKAKLTKSQKNVSQKQTVAVACAIVQEAEGEGISVQEVIDRIILESEEDA